MVSNIFEPIVLVDNKNLFYSHKSIKGIFYTVNSKVNKVFAWFDANKISLDEGKAKYTFIHISR